MKTITTLKEDRRARMKAGTAVTLMVMLMVGGLIAAIGLPIAVDEIAGNTSVQYTQQNGTAQEVNAELNSTVTDVETAGTTDNATVELNDTRTSGTTSKTIDNGSTATYSLDGGDVDVTLDDANTTANPDEATLTYEYQKDYAWGGAASSLWDNLGLIIILGAFLFFTGTALSVMRGVQG